MSVIIPDKIIESAHLSEEELKKEIAILLYKSGRITLKQASDFAEMNRIQFQHLLASRNISINYDIEDFKSDMETLKELGRI
ncbi:MAG: UPF0175 family protein [Spirochaetales bacterium]|nr:UPF0175 family protein [Spirochaetales bacterium]